MNQAEQILSADDRKSKVIPIEEWEGEFIVKELTAKAREDFEVEYQRDPVEATRGLKINIVINCLFNLEGEQVFDQSHAEALGEKSSDVVDRIFSKAQELSGINEESVEEAAKN